MNTLLLVPILGAISIGSVLWVLFTFAIGYCIFLVVQWAIAQFKLQEPVSTIVRILFVVAIAAFCINELLKLLGYGYPIFTR